MRWQHDSAWQLLCEVPWPMPGMLQAFRIRGPGGLIITIMQTQYIIYLIDSKNKEHDGYVFINYADAKQYVADCIQDGYATKAIIGMYVYDANRKQMMISHIDSIGFAGDAKDVNQLKLFKPCN